MEADGVIGGADLASMVPPDLFSGTDVSDSGDSGSDASASETDSAAQYSAESFDAAGDTAAEAAAEVPAEQTEEEPPVEAQPEAEKPEQKEAAQQDGELPEGVRAGKDRRGNDGYFVDANRWNGSIYPHHKLAVEASDLLGEPLTMDAIKVRENAYIGQRNLWGDLLSGDPQLQGGLIGQFFESAQKAVERGHVGSDPMVPFTETFYSTLRDKSPDAYAKLRLEAAKDLSAELYEEAAMLWSQGKADMADNLYRSVGRMLGTIGLPYKREAEREGYLSTAGQVNEAETLRRENQALKGQLNGKATQSAAAQYDNWLNQTTQNVQASILNDAIMPAVKDAETSWSKLKDGPDAFKDLVVGRLLTAVNEAITKDTRFQERINDLQEAARRATSVQRRSELQADIRQLTVNRAKLVVEAKRRPILEFASDRWKIRNETNNKRLAAGQTQRTPTGVHAPAPQSITPSAAQPSSQVFDPDVEVRKLMAFMR